MAATRTSERLSERELKAISAHAVARSFPAGTVVLSEGNATSSLYVVLSGRVKIFLADPAGREMVSRILKELTAGGYIRIETKRIVIAKSLPRGW